MEEANALLEFALNCNQYAAIPCEHKAHRYSAPLLYVMGQRAADCGKRLAGLTKQKYLECQWGYVQEASKGYGEVSTHG